MNIQELKMLDLDFDGMKRILTTPIDQAKQDELNKEKQEVMLKDLMELDFDELMRHNEPTVRRVLKII